MIFLNINQYKSVNFNQKHICDQKKAIYISFTLMIFYYDISKYKSI